MGNPLLTRRALLLAKIESVYNTDAVPVPALDALMVEEPGYSVDPTVLERNFVRNDLSPMGGRVGRKLASMEFSVEFRSNGRTNSGLIADASVLGRLLRACGYSETLVVAGAGTVGAFNAVDGYKGPAMTFAVSGSNNSMEVRRYRVSVIKGGISGVATLRISNYDAYDTSVLHGEGVTAQVHGDGPTTTVAVSLADPLAPSITLGGVARAGDKVAVTVGGYGFSYTLKSTDTLASAATALAAQLSAGALFSAEATGPTIDIEFLGTALGIEVTSGTTEVPLGNSGASIVPTFAGALISGDAYVVTMVPPGLKYQPVSENFESVTLYAYFDGLLHKMPGAFGTFTIDAASGNYAKATFTFTGQYIKPVDAMVPDDAVFETALPPVVELAKLQIDGLAAIVDTFSFDQANTISVRPDVNSPDGYMGVRITARAPTGGIDPEATLVADYDFWGKLASSGQVPFSMRIGQEAGNTIWITAPCVQYSGLTYADRDGIRTMDAGLSFSREFGNDEILFVTA